MGELPVAESPGESLFFIVCKTGETAKEADLDSAFALDDKFLHARTIDEQIASIVRRVRKDRQLLR